MTLNKTSHPWVNHYRKAIRRLAVVLGLGCALSAAGAAPARANHLNFTLLNKSGLTIIHLYVKAAHSDYWGRDILRQDLPSWQNLRVSFPGQSPSSPCVYDVKIIYFDYSQAVNRFNFCAVKLINVY